MFEALRQGAANHARIRPCELVFGAYRCLEFGLHFTLRAFCQTEPCCWTGWKWKQEGSGVEGRKCGHQEASESASH